jgi:hypothetical protein
MFLYSVRVDMIIYFRKFTLCRPANLSLFFRFKALEFPYKLNDHRLKAVGFVAAESRVEAKAS